MTPSHNAPAFGTANDYPLGGHIIGPIWCALWRLLDQQVSLTVRQAADHTGANPNTVRTLLAGAVKARLLTSSTADVIDPLGHSRPTKIYRKR